MLKFILTRRVLPQTPIFLDGQKLVIILSGRWVQTRVKPPSHRVLRLLVKRRSRKVPLSVMKRVIWRPLMNPLTFRRRGLIWRWRRLTRNRVVLIKNLIPLRAVTRNGIPVRRFSLVRRRFRRRVLMVIKKRLNFQAIMLGPRKTFLVRTLSQRRRLTFQPVIIPNRQLLLTQISRLITFVSSKNSLFLILFSSLTALTWFSRFSR